MSALEPSNPVFVFYDGVCASCSLLVQFLLARRKSARFRFISLQSLAGSPLDTWLRDELKLEPLSSVVVWKNGELLTHSTAILCILGELGAPWHLLSLAKIIPRGLRDLVYRLFAKHRYQLFGRLKPEEFCRVEPGDRRLFPLRFPNELPLFTPQPRVFLSAQWRHLVFINFAVPATLLEPYLPPDVELDPWEGQHLVSLVAFAFLGISWQGIRLPWASNLPEINLRFYVRRKQADGSWRRGVVFIRELVSSRTIALSARLLYGEPYQFAKVDAAFVQINPAQRWAFRWGEDAKLDIELDGPPGAMHPGSIESFITDHYFGYSKTRSAKLREYRVEHPTWRCWNQSKLTLSGAWADFYPKDFHPYLQKPHSCVVAEGSEVRIFQSS